MRWFGEGWNFVPAQNFKRRGFEVETSFLLKIKAILG
jgi:hypothetical protein